MSESSESDGVAEQRATAGHMRRAATRSVGQYAETDGDFEEEAESEEETPPVEADDQVCSFLDRYQID